MKKPAKNVLVALVLVALAMVTSLTLGSVASQSVLVRMPDGTILQVTEVPENAIVLGPAPEGPAVAPPLETPQDEPTDPLKDPDPTSDPEETNEEPEEKPEPGPTPVPPPTPTPAPAPVPPPAPPVQQAPAQPLPRVIGDAEQETVTTKKPAKRKTRRKVKAKPHRETGGTPTTRMRNSDGSPAPSNPGFVDALPGPSFATGVPNFVIRKFRVPIFLLPIYQAAGIQYGVRWEILAAINEIETDYGRNLNVSSAGALGWMQFMPPTWDMYGTDGNKDGKKDPYNPVDAIFSAARYLKAANYENDVRAAIWAYNHADWYVDSVLLRARLIAGVPADLVGSLTGLTEGRFPVAARARYADDLAERGAAAKKVKAGQNAANVVESDDNRRSIEIFAEKGSPVVATNDGEVKEIGVNEKLGRYLVLQDVYGNRYMYAGLGDVVSAYPVPKDDIVADPKASAKALTANDAQRDRKPTAPASRGRQPQTDSVGPAPTESASVKVAVKRRLFAHPDMPGARENGGYEQVLDAEAQSGSLTTHENGAAPLRFDPDKYELRPLKEGARVIGGTILGHVGATEPGKAANLEFGIRPAGRGAPRIDPKPILDGWKLLEATAVYRASGKNALRSGDGSISIGQILLLPKPLLEKRVLSDERINVYDCGRDDIRAGAIDRRVLATLAFLAETGLRPSVTSLKCGHGYFTSSGNVSHHSSGNAVDIAQINGVPILGHQDLGGVTEQAVRKLMKLQGTMKPSQIISLLDFGDNTVAMGDHADHIHVGFQPRYGTNSKLGKQARAVLKPGQWSDLLEQLRRIDNPTVPTKISKYAIPVRPKGD